MSNTGTVTSQFRLPPSPEVKQVAVVLVNGSSNPDLPPYRKQ